MSRANIRILVVDDEDLVRVNLTAYLEDEGYTVAAAVSGEEALELMKERTYDIGVIDLRLPGMDGNLLILKAHEIQPQMKFLIHTGSTSYTIPKALSDIGLSNSHIFRKPLVKMEQLVGLIRTLSE